MTVYDLIKDMDMGSKICIWIPDDDDCPAYEGYVDQMPWWLCKYVIYKGLDDGEDSLRVALIENNGRHDAELVIAAKEKDDNI